MQWLYTVINDTLWVIFAKSCEHPNVILTNLQYSNNKRKPQSGHCLTGKANLRPLLRTKSLGCSNSRSLIHNDPQHTSPVAMDCNHHTWHKISPAWEFLMARIVNFNHFNQPSYLMLEWLQLSSDNYQNHPLGSAKGGPGTCFGTLQRRPIWCHFGLGLPRIPGRSWAGTQTWDGFWTMICSSVVLQGIQRACGNSRNKTYGEWHLQISQVTKNKQPSTFNLQPCLKLALCSLGTGKTSSLTAFFIWVWRCRVKHWPFRLSNIFGTGEQAPCGIISSSPALPMGEASRKHLTISTVI